MFSRGEPEPEHVRRKLLSGPKLTPREARLKRQEKKEKMNKRYVCSMTTKNVFLSLPALAAASCVGVLFVVMPLLAAALFVQQSFLCCTGNILGNLLSDFD